MNANNSALRSQGRICASKSGCLQRTVRSEKSAAEKIKIFRRCFSGLKHVYGTYDPQTGRVCQLKEPVTDQVLLAHLTGKQSYGVYLLISDKTRALAVDFDIDDKRKPA